MKPQRHWIGSALALAAALGGWWAGSWVKIGGRPLLASPLDTLGALPRDAAQLGQDLLATFARAGAGLALGAAAGLVLGGVAALAMKRAPLGDALLDMARSVPPVVMLPVFLLALGFNDSARVATAAAGCVWTMALAVTTAARAPRSGRREQLELAGASRWRVLLWTQPWESLGALTVGLRTSASTAVVVAVVTEMVVGAPHGIGARVVSAQIAGDTDGLTLDIVAIGLAGWLLNLGLKQLERRASA